jgi:hypothetical protein
VLNDIMFAPKFKMNPVDYGRRFQYYLAGPMTGHEKFNYPAFAMAAEELRDCGYMIASPHEIDHSETEATRGMTKTAGGYLKEGFKLLLLCDGIILLPGWQQSRGALMEFNLALACDMHAWYYDGSQPYPSRLH